MFKSKKKKINFLFLGLKTLVCLIGVLFFYLWNRKNSLALIKKEKAKQSYREFSRRFKVHFGNLHTHMAVFASNH